MDNPIFSLLPKTAGFTAETLSPSAVGVVTAAAAAPLPGNLPATPDFSHHSRLESAAAKASENTPAGKSSSRADVPTFTGGEPPAVPVPEVRGTERESVTLPSSGVPPPSILLIALADLEVLQQSFCAHALVTPLKEQLHEFKQLVAASMRSELMHRHTESSVGDFATEARGDPGIYAKDTGVAAGESEKAASDGSEDEPAAVLSAVQVRDVAAHAALRAAHGYLYGSESLPVGVPVVHLQRARREWVAQYHTEHVQPRLLQAQRRLFEAWSQQQQRQWLQQSVANKRTGTRAEARDPSVLNHAMTPLALCAALRPVYWRNITTEWSNAGSATTITTDPATAVALPVKAGETTGSNTSVPPRRCPQSPTNCGRTGLPLHALSPAKAVWDFDLYDDLALAVSVEQREMMVHQTTSRIAIDATDVNESALTGFAPSTPPLSTTAAAGASTAPLTALSAPPMLLGRSGDLYQMQLTLPVFVYVVSRYLFIAQYGSYFPAGLFSRALLDPFYFPDASQCTPEYALRAAPVLRQEAKRVYASYTAQLADVHRCFPEGRRSTVVPLSPRDTYHLWALLCPPQRQDLSGRWKPLPWGQLVPEEEEALLAEEYKSAARVDQRVGEGSLFLEEPLLSYPHARAARQTYRRRLQQLAQHPSVLDEVSRLLSRCEDVAFRFFSTIDTEQKGYITWEAFTNALIEEADVVDYRRKVSERAANLTRSSASVFDRYIVEPLAPVLVRLGYTGNIFEVRHSASLVMLEGSIDYAVCDGTQLGSIHQRFLVRPMEVLCKEMEGGDSFDSFGRPIGRMGSGLDRDGGDRAHRRQSASLVAVDEGYDESLRRRPWRHNQRPPRVYIRYEDGRRLQESTALSLLQQLGRSPTTGVGMAADEGGSEGDEEGEATKTRSHQSEKLVCLEGALLVEGVSPLVPLPVFVARSNDMLLRFYATSRAVQSMPEAGALRCSETVASMDWAAGGSGECRFSSHGVVTPTDGAAPSAHASSSPIASLPPHRRMHHDRLSVPRQEYLLLGTRSGTIILVDLYAVLNRVPRLATLAAFQDADNVRAASSHPADKGAGVVGGNSGVASPTSAITGAANTLSERIGNSSNAWTGYRALAQRTYYGDIRTFTVHTRQVHKPGALVSSVMAVATSGLVVSSGLDGDVFTMRLAYSPAWMASTGAQRTPYRGIFGVATPTTDTNRPLVRIEVLHRVHVCDTGVRLAIPIPLLSLLAVHTVTNKVFLYHTSVLPTAPALVDGGCGNAASAQVSNAVSLPLLAASEGAGVVTGSGVATVAVEPPVTLPRLELYDASAPHLRSIVTMVLVEGLDQLITVDCSGYVKVWSVRQAQPITSFYAWAPFNVSYNNSVGGAGRPTGLASFQGITASALQNSSASGAKMSACGASSSSAVSLLRMTKNSIEAEVEGAEYRLQPCRSAAYNYAGRQLFVMGSNNAAHCFFLSGQSSVRAHTEPLRVLLVDAATAPQASGVHRRLISLSSADCRFWTLLTGAMVLGIRVSSAEYRHLMDSSTAASNRGKSTTSVISKERQRLESRGGRSNSRRGVNSRSGYSTRIQAAFNSAFLTSSYSTVTTGERQRLLPPSVDDVMEAVSARPFSGLHRSHRFIAKSHDAAPAVNRSSKRGESALGAGAAPSQLLSLVGLPHGSSTTPDNSSSGGIGQGGGGDDDTDGLMSVTRDQNVLLSDIRCACLGGGGQWVSYALAQGDIRLHRCDSGRLLRTFTTTPPFTEDLVEAAMQYQHLFSSITTAATMNIMSAGLSAARSSGGGGGASGASSSLTTTPPRAPSVMNTAAQLTPPAYAQAVALVLHQILTNTSGVSAGSAAAAPASTTSGEVTDQLSRNVHREPLHMLYLDNSHELLVVYADGLLRVFSLLSYSPTASRVIVSRTLVYRAMRQVQRVLASLNRPASAVHYRTAAAGIQISGASSTRLAAGPSGGLLEELLKTGGIKGADVDLCDAEDGEGRIGDVASGSSNSRRVLRTPRSGGAGGSVAGGRLNGVGAAETMPPAAAAASPVFLKPAMNTMQALIVSLPEHKIDPDVVLLATASPPLGLVCLVHASGLVTVLDTQSRGEAGSGARMRTMLSSSDGMDNETGGYSGGAEPHTQSVRAQACVVAHAFMTTDEVTAATFLGAYPCLVLADRQRRLSFHLMRGSSVLALLGELAEEVEKDSVACASRSREQVRAEGCRNAALLGLPCDSVVGRRGAEEESNAAQQSFTLAWTVSIDDTCASQRALGHVTALTFDALYATLYVGTSQGYIFSYLVRRFLTAFQLTPVFLRGANGVDASTYAAELQRALTTAHPGASPGSGGNITFLQNYLRVVFGLPQDVLAQMEGTSCSTPQKPHISSSSHATSPASTSPNPPPKDASSIVDVYKRHRDIFQSSWSDTPAQQRDTNGGGTHATTLSRISTPCTSSEVFIAAAVLHDAVARMMTVASAVPAAGKTRPGTSAAPMKAQPWWFMSAGKTVQEYVARKCGCNTTQIGTGESAGAATASAAGHGASSDVDSRSTGSGELELDANGVMLLREWVAAALTEQRLFQQHHTGDAESVQGAQQPPQQSGRNSTALSDTQGGGGDAFSRRSLSNSSGFTALPPMPSSIEGRAVPDSGAARVDADRGLGAGGVGNETRAPAALTSEQLAEALVQEVEEELLFGVSVTTTKMTTGISATPPPAFTPEEEATPSNPITDTWVECLFTRHAVCITSRSPLSLLTPPAMLERARRERQDRRGRITAAAASGNAAGSGSEALEWDAYVEGTLPNYLTEILNHPNHVLTMSEQQALQQRSITTLKCRRNGYLCIGHADGGVTLWTPYACARLESLCPSTTLVSTLDRLVASVKAQFHYAVERAVAQRQRIAYEGALTNAPQGEEEEVAYMKNRIRTMLLGFHLDKLQSEGTGDEGRKGSAADKLTHRDQDTECQSSQSTPGTRALHHHSPGSPVAERRDSVLVSADGGTHCAAKSGVPAQPFVYGSIEAELLTMRPLLCLLLGVSSPAQLRARQLSLEDLFFLPLQMRSIAFFEGFNPQCYDMAVDVAMHRLQRELIEVSNESATEQPHFAGRVFPDALTAAVVQGVSTVSASVTPLASHDPRYGSSHGLDAVWSRQGVTSGHLCRTRLRSIYDYRLSSLVQAWCNGADLLHHGASGAADFPGALRLLLHRAMEGLPHLSDAAAAENSSCAEGNEVKTHGRASSVGFGPSGATQGTTAQTDPAHSVLPKTFVTADSTAQADGEYYEVCHALQVAEVKAETLWEVEELDRVYQQLQNFIATADASPMTRRPWGEAGLSGVGESHPAQLPRLSTAAVADAVSRQLRRGIEMRVTALSNRMVAASLLRDIKIRFRPPPPPPPPTRAAQLPPAAFQQSGAVGWVLHVLHEQARQAFRQPRLTWKQPAPSLPTRSLASTSKPSLSNEPIRERESQSDPTALSETASASYHEKPLPTFSNSAPPFTLPHIGGDGPLYAGLVSCSNASDATVFITEMPRDASDVAVGFGASLLTPAPTPLHSSGKTATASTARIGMCDSSSLSSRRLSNPDESLLYNVEATLPPQKGERSLLLLPVADGASPNSCEGHQRSTFGARNTRMLGRNHSDQAVPSMPDRAPLASHLLPSPSHLETASSPTNAGLHSHTGHSKGSAQQRLFPLVALHRTTLARTGSGAAAPHQRRSTSRGLGGTKDSTGGRTVTASALPSAAAPATAAMPTLRPATAVGTGGVRRGARAEERLQRSRAATVQSFTYYSLLSKAATTK
ncbi:hypothetical protein JKF63_06441 [Porcisia hertigi]|uniref:Uncharacterized protein n=1 Tax=Porcisia hertigi TaxID=2761500 RepID=A0A836LJX8_9TRYP|nr:hypothetical protein JKF63_06441 [Porcisia hertigi]